jgi:hypothetical protein
MRKMKSYICLLVLALICGNLPVFGQSATDTGVKMFQSANRQTDYECLPDDIKPETIVSAVRVTSDLRGKVKIETVRQRLGKLKAKCKAGKLVGTGGKEIRFYQLQGCWGNPPADYREILDNQRKEIQALKRRFVVIEITCNSTGEMPY